MRRFSPILRAWCYNTVLISVCRKAKQRREVCFISYALLLIIIEEAWSVFILKLVKKFSILRQYFASRNGDTVDRGGSICVRAHSSQNREILSSVRRMFAFESSLLGCWEM